MSVSEFVFLGWVFPFLVSISPWSSAFVTWSFGSQCDLWSSKESPSELGAGLPVATMAFGPTGRSMPEFAYLFSWLVYPAAVHLGGMACPE